MIEVPSKSSKKWSVSLESDLFGNIIRSRNLDFNKKGYLSLARKPYTLLTEAEDADFESPLAIISDGSNFFVFTSEEMFEVDGLGGDFSYTKRTSGTPPSFGFQTDAVFWQGIPFASGGTTIGSFASGSWTERITGLSGSFPHPLCVSEHQNYLAVGNGNTVRLYNTSYSLVTTCTVSSEHVVTWIRWVGNLLYFGTRSTSGGEAKMFVWNGAGTAAQNGHGAGCDWIFSGCEFDGTIVVVTSRGQLLRYTGAGFTQFRSDDGRELNLPVYYTNVPWGSSAAQFNLRGKVTSRGMKASGRRLYIVVNSNIEYTNGGTPNTLPNFPGGLWVADPAGPGLYHKAGADHKQRSKVTPTSLSDNTLTLSSAEVFETGDPIYCTAVGSLTGDIDGDMIYYAIKVSSTQFKLAWTPQQAKDGEFITVTGTTTSSEFHFNVYEAVGALKGEAGPVEVFSALGMPRFNGIEVVYGMDIRNPSGTTVGCVMSLGMGKNVGSLTTPKFQAGGLKDAWQKLFAKFPPLNVASRKIVIKYRTENRWGLPGRMNFNGGRATWVTSTSFTINPKTYDVYSIQEGDEVEFISGAAAGYTAHIATGGIVEDSATQWTITIDEAMPDVAASETSDVIFDNWTKHKTISTTDDAKAAARGLKQAILKKKAKWCQLRIEIRGYTDIEETHDIEELMLINSTDQNYT
jgi:hypothetical protein